MIVKNNIRKTSQNNSKMAYYLLTQSLSQTNSNKTETDKINHQYIQ